MIGLLLPAAQAAREAARRMQCTNNFKQCILGTRNYVDRVVQNKEAIFRCGSDQGQGYRCQPTSAIADGTSNATATSEISQVGKSQDINGKATADERGALWYPWGCAYSAFFAPNTQETDDLGRIPPRAANAIFAPATDKTLDAAIVISARSRHSGGVNVAMADGSVRFVSDTINLDVWAVAGTAKGGETETF